MLFSTFTAALVFATSAYAAALPPQAPQPGKPHTYTPAKNLDKLASLFPKSNLTGPGDLALKYVVLGIGTQNYTCASPDESVTPGTTGAVATLYDIGSKLNNDRDANWKIGTLSPLALSMSEWAPQLLDMSLKSQGYENIAGHHFFASVAGTNTPTFAFDQLAAPYPMAQVAKIGSVDAPKTACQGKNGLPAVAWLYLQHQAGISQGGINTVYRVETAGGNKPATCKGMPASWEVKYAAQYWVYGPKQ